jgi:hypothetical protein
MPNEMNPRFWTDLNTLRESLQQDPVLKQEFEREPLEVLKRRGLDVEVTLPQGNSQVKGSLSKLFENLTKDEQKVTIESLIELSRTPDLGRVAAVTPVANANAGANANVVANVNAGANANAAANANVNTNGMAARDLLSEVAGQLRLPMNFQSSVFASKLQELQLNEARQVALVKRALTNPDSLVKSSQTPGGEQRVVRYSFRGLVFEIEALVRGQEFIVQNVSIVS